MEEETMELDMATDQFSSLDGILSIIPDHITHRILACLPTIKDVVRTSAVSKSWLQAWRTFQISQFDLNDSVSRSTRLSGEAEVESKTNQFISFVDSTLQRFARQNHGGLQNFNLCTDDKMHHHTTRWIGMALDIKIEHLALRIFSYGFLHHSCLMVPDRLLSAYWLKSLKLVGEAICIQSLTESTYVYIPLLTSLRIENSKHIKDEQLQKLLSGCPVLEDIALSECALLSNVDLFEQPNLKTLEVKAGSVHLTAIRVTAPKLKSFGYESNICDVVVKIQDSPELKSLTIRDRNKTDEWFHKFIAQFPLIENLAVDSCHGLRKIRISNPRLEKISIINCNNLEDVVISCNKLESFSLFTLESLIPKPSIQIKMDTPPNDCTAQILVDFEADLMMEASWYCKLKEFLTRPLTFKKLNIFLDTLYSKDGDMKGEDVHKKLPRAACNIEKLRLMYLDAPSSCHSHILNGLLSACHPNAIKLDVNDSDTNFIKLICEELGNRENNRKCWCKDDFKCWKHQLKEVKIEKITGIELEKKLDWDDLFDLLPTLERENSIYFKLVW